MKTAKIPVYGSIEVYGNIALYVYTIYYPLRCLEYMSQSGMVEGMIRQAQEWFKHIYTLLYKIIDTTT